jgi:mannosyltransferase
MLNKLLKFKYFTQFFLVFLVSIACTISVRFFIPESLRLDESQSIIQSNRPYLAMLESLARDVHMPLYASLLHVWINVFGNSISTNRFLSLFFYLASICICYIFSFEFTKKRKISVYITLIFTFSPFLHWFGSELRMYSMFTFLTLCLHYLFFKIFYKNQSQWYNWLGYFILLVFGIYTHYFFLLFIFSQVVFLLFNMQFLDTKKRWLLATSLVLLIILFLPWFWYVTNLNTASSQTPLLVAPSSVDLFNLYSNHLFGFQSDSLNSMILSSWPLIGLIPIFLLQKRRHGIQLKHYYLIIMTFLPTFLLFCISRLVRPIFLSRYLIMCLPPLYILVGLVLFSFQKSILKYTKYVFLTFVIASLVIQINNPYSSVKEDYRGVINHIISQVNKNDVVGATAPFTVFPFDYYYNGSAKLVTLPNWNRGEGIPEFSEPKLLDQLNELSKTYNRFYLVSSYDQGYEKKIENIVSNQLDFDSKKEYARIKLMVFRFKKQILPEKILPEVAPQATVPLVPLE